MYQIRTKRYYILYWQKYDSEIADVVFSDEVKIVLILHWQIYVFFSLDPRNLSEQNICVRQWSSVYVSDIIRVSVLNIVNFIYTNKTFDSLCGRFWRNGPILFVSYLTYVWCK